MQTTSHIPAALQAIEGETRACEFLNAVNTGVAGPNALALLAAELASQPDALEGAMRAIQKRLEAHTW